MSDDFDEYLDQANIKLFDDELSETMTFDEYNSIRNREMISLELWERFYSICEKATGNRKYFLINILSDTDFLERLANYHKNFEIMKLVVENKDSEKILEVWGAEHFAPKIQASINGRKNVGTTKAQWKKLFRDEYENYKSDLPQTKGWMTLLHKIASHNEYCYFDTETERFLFDTDGFDSIEISFKTIQNEFTKLKKQ